MKDFDTRSIRCGTRSHRRSAMSRDQLGGGRGPAATTIPPITAFDGGPACGIRDPAAPPVVPEWNS